MKDVVKEALKEFYEEHDSSLCSAFNKKERLTLKAWAWVVIIFCAGAVTALGGGMIAKVFGGE